jgi:hypothetical protein
MILDDFRCGTCGWTDEEFHRRGEDTRVCPSCGGEAVKVPPVLQYVPNFGQLMVRHEPGRRLSPFERDRREHWNRTRLGDQAPPDMTERPKVFIGAAS